MAYTKRLLDARTGEQLRWARFTGASVWFDPVWPWVQRAASEEFDCDLDDVDEVQDDDGRDYVTVRGEIVARVQ